MPMIIVNSGKSDLPCLLDAKTTDSLEKAIAKAKKGSPILCLGGDYPIPSECRLSDELLAKAQKKQLKLYVEYADECGRLAFGEAVQPPYSRFCISSPVFGKSLPPFRILVPHSCWARPVNAEVAPLMVLARVAGYRKAVFGLPENTLPILFFHPDYPNVLVATSGLSHFARGRYAPEKDWLALWNWILEWLGADERILCCDTQVHPTFGAKGRLPKKSEMTAFQRNREWLRNYMIGSTNMVYEGFTSGIDEKGSQRMGTHARGDCTGEVLPVFAYGWKHDHNPKDKQLTLGILKNLFGHSLGDSYLLCDDKTNPCYGMLRFYDNLDAYYGDDNLRSAMGCILASEWIGTDLYDEQILRCLLSVLRTTGPLGFRETALRYPAVFADGKNWDYFRDKPTVNLRAHSQGWMWAGFIMAWRATGHAPFLQKGKLGIRAYMKKFPDEVTWTNGLAQEIARMLLPLAMLVEVEDTKANRALLEKCFRQLEPQLDHGGVRELLGKREHAMYPAPDSNEKYGVTEAPLIQENGDPCCDLLYTTNYAFPGLHEAALATGNPKYAAAADKMADFLARIQSTSKSHPELDGLWFRGFDTELWEYFGSSADTGWSAWCVETGWTNSWIPLTFALRHEKQSMLSCVTPKRFVKILPKLLEEMSIVHPLVLKETKPQFKAPGAE